VKGEEKGVEEVVVKQEEEALEVNEDVGGWKISNT
jgi:hypothetical protein